MIHDHKVLPTVGRIIHVIYPHDQSIPCRAAIVTGLDHQPDQIIHIAEWSKRGDQSVSTIANDEVWHWPTECDR